MALTLFIAFVGIITQYVLIIVYIDGSTPFLTIFIPFLTLTTILFGLGVRKLLKDCIGNNHEQRPGQDEIVRESEIDRLI